MGRRDRHAEEDWEETRRRQASEPQGSPPPEERSTHVKDFPGVDLDLMLPRASTLVAPKSAPSPPRVEMDESAAAIMEKVLIAGDLASLTEEERVTYYKAVCKSLGLNPLTRPFAYIVLNGALTLYARRDCADQLRRINGVSIEIVDRKVANDILTIHVRAMDKYGRVDEDIGAVDLYEVEGVDLANAVMKCLTKAKRRVTLSISGLGFLDESEVESVLAAEQPHESPRPRKGRGRGRKAKSEPVVTIQPSKAGEKKPLPPLVQRHVEVIPEEDPG